MMLPLPQLLLLPLPGRSEHLNCRKSVVHTQPTLTSCCSGCRSRMWLCHHIAVPIPLGLMQL